LPQTLCLRHYAPLTNTTPRGSNLDIILPKRALISVSDKTGIVELAKFLSDNGCELLSTGGTAAAIRKAGLTCKDVSEHTKVSADCC